MGFFLGLLKLLFGKREPWTPLFTLSDCEDDEGPQLRFDCEGDYTGECCEILDRLCAGRFAAIWMEDLFWMEQRQEKKTREIVYHTTFPMYYAQEIAGTDDLLRMHGDWKELISVSRGFDRKLFAAFLETSYVHCCDDRLYVFDETPPVCRTLREAQALRKIPCRFTAEYTPYDGALIFRDICSGTARQEAGCVSERGNGRIKAEKERSFSALAYSLFFFAELVLANAAERADPIFGDFFPRCAGGDAVIGIADLRVIDIAADIADVFHTYLIPPGEIICRSSAPEGP